MRRIAPTQGYKDPTKSGTKTYKPPNSTPRQWVLIRDPKSKIPQMVPMLSRTQKMKLQRKYSLFQEETLKGVTSAMLEEDLDPPSPNSLASYQSGLLEAMLVEQGGLEGSYSPMELSLQEA
ncbi:hypothetical protein RHGRI_036946 [Rhododendron griersonianum]|uniref:Uncharacterized protein n=1 Tax=Rhododendron griersonianum TaxID=479676 RepID=A0AAV6HPU9_9ERIC|nr:hypothetical protein RHGRI_036946 [Rhododendron griersonianum]